MDSIKDPLIPYVSSLQSSNNFYDYLTNLFTINNIGQTMSLKNEVHEDISTKRPFARN